MVDLIVKSKLKDFIRELGFNTSSDVEEALNEIVKDLVTKASKRTKANYRKTLSGKDL